MRDTVVIRPSAALGRLTRRDGDVWHPGWSNQDGQVFTPAILHICLALHCTVVAERQVKTIALHGPLLDVLSHAVVASPGHATPVSLPPHDCGRTLDLGDVQMDGLIVLHSR